MASPALRRKQVRAAELVGTTLTYAEAGAVVGRSERTVARWLEDPDLRAIADREGALPGEVGPAEILHGALWATKANGQPDWPTRVSAARALAALRPEELEPKTKQQPTESSIFVYDLPPGAPPVLHHPREGAEAPASDAEASAELLPTSSSAHWFYYDPSDSEESVLGRWFPDLSQLPDGFGVQVVVHKTDDSEEAERWRAQLSAGRLPQSTENGL
jgi:hypothetical protein